MFAIIQCGGKQYKVAKDDVLFVEKLEGKAGDTVELSEVIMVTDGGTSNVGSPLLKGASVSATVLEQRKTDKVIIFKKKRRQNYRRKRGHRQNITVIKITGIKAA